MSEVTVYSNWGYWDHLDGEELKEGERVVVTWPDGTESEHVVVTEKSSDRTLDHGHWERLPIVKAFVVVAHQGAEVRVRLHGSGADVRRVES